MQDKGRRHVVSLKRSVFSTVVASAVVVAPGWGQESGTQRSLMKMLQGVSAADGAIVLQMNG